MSRKRKSTRGGGAAAAPSCGHTTVPLLSREESNALTWGLEAAGASSKSSGSPSPGVQSRSTPAPPQASRPERCPVPPSPPSGPYTMSGIRADTELGADITRVPGTSPSPAALPPPPAGISQRASARGRVGSAPLPLIGPGGRRSEEPTKFIHSSRSQARAGSGCRWKKKNAAFPAISKERGCMGKKLAGRVFNFSWRSRALPDQK